MKVETAPEELAEREAKALQRVTDTLFESFTDSYPKAHVENIIDDARRRFDGDPIRDFVPILVERIVRRQLEPPHETELSEAEKARAVPGPTARPRIPLRDRRVVAALAVTALLIAAGVVVAVRQPGDAPAADAAAAPRLTTVRGVIGSEKMAFFEDPKVADALARKGLKVQVEPAGSRQIATTIDLGVYDFAFPSSLPAADRIQRQRNITTKYTPFSSPMAIATFRPVADLLAREGIVRPGPVTTFDMAGYLRLVRANLQWSELPGNTAYPVRKNILISTTDPRTSNSAAMYLAVASYSANEDVIVGNPAAEQHVLPTLARLFVGQGYTENSTEGPFAQYLSAGMGPAPMVWIYESQFVAATGRGQVTPDMVLMYPSPTVLSRHTLVPLGANGDRLGKLLTTDPELQRLAAEHGFRTGDPNQFAKVAAERKVPVPTELIDVVETPTYDTLERLLEAVTKSYN